MSPDEYRPPSTVYRALHAYYRSGWAFLIPYLAAYLLYAWLGWPVNAGDSPPFTVFRPPSLLHVYWFLHAVHAIMAGVALWHWWRAKASGLKLTAYRLPLTALLPQPQLSTGYRLLPWLLLALLFFIPGLYLEWPSDPWEHLRRINEWHAHSLVTEHSAWKKSSYFLPYSLTGFTTGLTQLSWLNFYYTGISLLLCWQYYRLARAVGLGERAAMLFVILQALLMGNNVFSFYRYYGLSSSIFAQLGAIALTRIALDTSRPGTSKLATSVLARPPSTVQARLPAACPPLTALSSVASAKADTRYPLLRLGAAVLCLLPLIALNHPQGLGIAGLGIMAVVVWRLIEWKRAMLGWLALAAVVASVATVLWFPRHPAIDEIYRPQGWLNGWYGFNLFATGSPAFGRSLHILGAFGVLNLALGLWLVLRRNHVAGWLTLMPVLALVLPCFALPFAHVVASQTHAENIVIFHRMLLAVPLGMAMVAAFSRSGFASIPAAHHDATNSSASLPATGYSLSATRYWQLCTIGLAGVVILSPGSSSYNRFWHSLQVTPADLQLRPHLAAWTPANLALAQKDFALLVTSPLGAMAREAFQPSLNWHRFRQIHGPLNTAEIEQRLDLLSVLEPADWVAATGEPKSGALYIRRNPATPEPRLVAGFTARDTSGLPLGGHPVVHTITAGHLTLRNPIGEAAETFNPELIPIERSKRYHLTSTLRQTGDPTATNYLAVAWYDAEGRLLQSHAPHPEGAGTPVGWSNGTYSYYGLINQPAPVESASYSIAFGLGEAAAIPINAAFIRVGALLNYHRTPETITQLTTVTLQEKPPHRHLLFVVPGFTGLYARGSQAARLSGHWLPQQIFMEQGGTRELHMYLAPAAKP